MLLPEIKVSNLAKHNRCFMVIKKHYMMHIQFSLFQKNNGSERWSAY